MDFAAWLKFFDGKNYYEMLRVKPDAPFGHIKAAFHHIAQHCHPDKFADADPNEARAAAEVFKRAVEAYQVLSRPATRKRYDTGLAKGRVRFEPRRVSVAPPAPAQRTLEMIAQTKKGKVYAAKADRFIAIGKLEDARLQLVSACQEEPDNAELDDRMRLLWDALALEGL
jgi:curved DNA-binding protein CbpA